MTGMAMLASMASIIRAGGDAVGARAAISEAAAGDRQVLDVLAGERLAKDAARRLLWRSFRRWRKKLRRSRRGRVRMPNSIVGGVAGANAPP
jgi:hypothetical protein